MASEQLPPKEHSSSVPPHAKFALDPALRAFARSQRQQHSDAEHLMWSLLRGRRFSGMKFRRQQPIARYVLDFYCDEAKIAIELDGGQHNTESARRHDSQRTTFLQERGIIVLRFWNNEVLEETEGVLEAIHNALTPTLSQRERE
jgi:very-short-patch-repair endonuclease